MRKSFGNSLDAVLSIAATTETAPSSMLQKELKSLLVQKIIPGQFQPRRLFEPEALQELANSIQEQGILQPIIVRKVGADLFEIIAGERRWRAAQMAGLQQVPVIICDLDDQAALAFGLIENIQRQDLNPIEEAESLQRLIAEFNMTHDQVAKAVGRSRVMVSNLIRLLSLSEAVKEWLNQGLLEMGHARALLGVAPDEQVQIAEQVIAKALSVRETERRVQQSKQLKQVPIIKKISPQQEKENLLQKQLATYFSMDVQVKLNQDGSGKMILQFESIQQLEVELLALTSV